jgi:hypothetical protein
VPEGAAEEAEDVEEDAAADWLELESTFELDVDASGLDVVDIETDDIWEIEELLESTFELDVDANGLEVVDVETDDNWEVEELLELDTVLEMEDRTVELDKDDEVDIFELEEMAVAVVELDAFDIVVPPPTGGAIA